MNALAEFFGGHPWWVYLLAFFPVVSLIGIAVLWLFEILEWLGLKQNFKGPTYPKQATKFLGFTICFVIPYVIVVLMISKACQR